MTLLQMHEHFMGSVLFSVLCKSIGLIVNLYNRPLCLYGYLSDTFRCNFAVRQNHFQAPTVGKASQN
jgi:hypothetical protein